MLDLDVERLAWEGRGGFSSGVAAPLSSRERGEATSEWLYTQVHDESMELRTLDMAQSVLRLALRCASSRANVRAVTFEEHEEEELKAAGCALPTHRWIRLIHADTSVLAREGTPIEQVQLHTRPHDSSARLTVVFASIDHDCPCNA
jgi:hypothetical protein